MKHKKYFLIQKIVSIIWLPVAFIVALWSGDPMSEIQLTGEWIGSKKNRH